MTLHYLAGSSLALVLRLGVSWSSVEAGSLHAQQEEICLTVARTWRGGPEEIRQIDRIPVPESYLRLFNAGGCTRFQLVEESLIDWHLDFGDERTTTVALAFFEVEYSRGRPPTPAFADELRGAWTAADPILIAGKGLTAKQRDDPRLRRLRKLVELHKNYALLADQYLRAAEFFGSKALYEKAGLYFAPVRTGYAILYAEQGNRPAMADSVRDPYDDVGLSTLTIQKVQDLDMRLAIMQARLSREPGDIEAAQAVIDRYYRPVARQAADQAYDHQDFCDDLKERSDLAELAHACATENSIHARLTRFWVNQAILDLLKASDPQHFAEQRRPPISGSGFVRRRESGYTINWPRTETFDHAMLLLDRRKRSHSAATLIPHRSDADRAAVLHMARSEALARLAELANRSRSGASHSSDQLIMGALNDLSDAAQLLLPAESPGRFRQIAERYLQLRVRYNALAVGPHPIVERQATYFSSVLSRLDAIKVGEIVVH